MAFWGVEVKPGKPFTLKPTEATGTRRLHLSQATLGHGGATVTSTLQCIVGNKSPLYLCVLNPEKIDSCQLNLEFEESDDVIFSVIGPRSVHLTGYFLGGRSSAFKLNDDESESYGEDIVDTDVEKASSDDYDYSDSFINDDDPSGRRGSRVSSSDDDDDEISIKEMAAKRKEKKVNGKVGGRLRKKFQVSDSDSIVGDSAELGDSDNDYVKITKVVSSENPLPSRTTRSKARSSVLENGESNAKSEKTSEAKKEKPLGDVVELAPVEKDCEIISEKKKKKEKSKSVVVVVNSDDEGIENKKQANEREEMKPSSDDVLASQENGDATPSKKKRKRDKKKENTENKKQATDKNMEKADTKKPVEAEVSSNEVTIEEIKKGNSDGKSAVKGKKVSILYTGKLRTTGKLFDSNFAETPLRFRLGGEKVIKGLSIGVEGMRVGDKRRLIIPPSLGYADEGLKEDVPKDAWLVYEVEAVKV